MAPESSPDALDEALDELYGVDPEHFVTTRKRLATELRAAGDKVAAKALQAARRPTTAAWALNRVSRDAPELVAAFLECSRALEAAQNGALAGERDAMRDATRAQRDALGEATDAAVARLGDRATDAYRAQILATLQAASADATVGEDLRAGRIVREASGAVGFPGVPGLTLVPDLEPAGVRPAPESPKRRPPVDTPRQPRVDGAAEKARIAERRRIERERQAAERSERRRAEAEAASAVAREEASVAEAAAAAAHERVAALERDLVEARRAARLADDHAARTARDASRLSRAATKLRSRTETKAAET